MGEKTGAMANAEVDEGAEVEQELVLREIAQQLQASKRKASAEQEEVDALTQQLQNESEQQRKHINSLASELAEKQHELVQLEEQERSLQREVANERTTRTNEAGKIQDAHKQQMESLSAEEEHKADAVAALRHFEATEKEQIQWLENMHEQIEQEEASHQNNLRQIAHSVEEDKQKLEERMEREVRETKNAVLDEANKKLEPEVVDTIAENERVASELAYQARRGMQIEWSSKKLDENIQEAEQREKTLRESAAHVATCSSRAKGSIDALHAKLQREQTALSNTKAKRECIERDTQNINAEIAHVEEQLKQVHERMQLLDKAEAQKQSEAADMQNVQSEALMFLQQSLHDIDDLLQSDVSDRSQAHTLSDEKATTLASLEAWGAFDKRSLLRNRRKAVLFALSKLSNQEHSMKELQMGVLHSEAALSGTSASNGMKEVRQSVLATARSKARQQVKNVSKQEQEIQVKPAVKDSARELLQQTSMT